MNQSSTHEYPLVCFDLDGTLVDDTIYIWSTFHEHFRTDASRRKNAKADFFAGRITYEQWFNHDLELLDEAGATRESMVELIRSLSVMPGALEVLEELRAQGRKIAVISGSVDLVVQTLFGEEHFDEILINKLHFNNDGTLRGGDATPYDLEKKALGLETLAREHGITTSGVAFIGDNSNDIEVARVAGRAIAFNCKSEGLAAVADVVVDEHDLRAVLPHL